MKKSEIKKMVELVKLGVRQLGFLTMGPSDAPPCLFVFSVLASFESTLSILLKGKFNDKEIQTGFSFSYREVFLTFAYVGFTLLIAHRCDSSDESRIAFQKKYWPRSEPDCSSLAMSRMCVAIQRASSPILFTSLTIVTFGFSFVTPSLFD